MRMNTNDTNKTKGIRRVESVLIVRNVFRFLEKKLKIQYSIVYDHGKF